MTIKATFEGTRFQLLRGTEQEWAEANPILGEGEEGVVFAQGKATYSKIGDGKTRWNDLEIFHGLPGKDGVDGAPGKDGKDGKDGEAGPPGPRGAQGPQGDPGKDSTVPGPRGMAGKDGKDGIDGEPGPEGPPGKGVPSGGDAGQVLVKKSREDYDTEWQYQQGGVAWTNSGGGGGGADALDDLTDVVITAPIADDQVLKYDIATGKWINDTNPAGVTDHGLLTGLEDDDHTQYIKHSLATAANDFLVASGVGVFVKKTLAEVKTALGLGSAAYTASSDYAVAAKGVTNGDSHDHSGGDGGQISHASLSNITATDHHSNANDPTADEKAALAGTSGTAPSGTNKLVDNADTRLSDARTPDPHNLIDTTGHPVTGLTTGHFLKATGATAYGFGAHGLTASDVSAIAAPATPEQGDILYYNGSAWVSLAHGTSGQYLKTNGHAGNPQWADVTGGSGDEVMSWFGL